MAAPAAWVASTAVAAGIAWWAVSAVGAPGQAPDSVLSEGEVAAALAAERDALAAAAADPSSSPSPSTSPSASASPDPTPGPDPAATPVVRTWSLDGGTVSAACAGDVVSLEYATPAGGWRVDVKERGPGARVLVELERDGVETYVQAVCVAGTPEYTLVADDSGGSGSGGAGGTDDSGEDHSDGGGETEVGDD